MTRVCAFETFGLAAWLLITPVLLTNAEDRPYLTTKTPITLLSANDGGGETSEGALGLSGPLQGDSITVIHLGPDHPPIAKTVYGTVPNTGIGVPRMAISGNGRYGFVTNHSWRGDSQTDETTDVSNLPPDRQNLLTVIDLADPGLKVVQQIPLPANPWMAVAHPDGKRIFVSTGNSFYVFAVDEGGAKLIQRSSSPVYVLFFDISPRGDRIVAVGPSSYSAKTPLPEVRIEIHLFAIRDAAVEYLQRIDVKEGAGIIDRPFAPRIAPDGRRAVVLNGLANSAKLGLDDVLVLDLSLQAPKVTDVIPQVGDGLESVAFHPSGQMAVVSCIDNVPPGSQRASHLAVIDLSSRPSRLLYHLPIGAIPQGIEFTPDGSKLFVQISSAHHIAVFDVSGFMLKPSPFVLHTGHSPSSLAIGPRFPQ